MTNDLLSSFVKSLWMKFRSILFKGILFKRRLDVCVYGKIFVRKIKGLYLFRVYGIYTLFERIKFYFRKSRFKNYQKRQEDSIVMFFLVRNRHC